jgi:hypothetical protein
VTARPEAAEFINHMREQDPAGLEADRAAAWGTEPADDPHADCIQPHRGPDGDYHDCDGRPL